MIAAALKGHPATTLEDLKLPVVRGMPELAFKLLETCEFRHASGPR